MKRTPWCARLISPGLGTAKRQGRHRSMLGIGHLLAMSRGQSITEGIALSSWREPEYSLDRSPTQVRVVRIAGQEERRPEVRMGCLGILLRFPHRLSKSFILRQPS